MRFGLARLNQDGKITGWCCFDHNRDLLFCDSPMDWFETQERLNATWGREYTYEVRSMTDADIEFAYQIIGKEWDDAISD